MPWNVTNFDSTGKIKDARVDRSIRGRFNWETGAIQANGFQDAGGIYTDGFFIQTLTPDGAARTITGIDNSTTPKADYTGALLSEGDGLQMPVISTGMTELSERLIRVRNPTASDFDVYQDGDDTGFNPTQTTEGNTQTNTSGYGTWSGTAAAQGYIGLATGDGNPSLPTDADVRVVTSIVPPTNDVGTANEVFPLRGSHFLSNTIFYWKPNGVIPGNTDNRPRNSERMGAGQDFAYNEEEFICWPYNLPSNFDHETTHDGNRSKNALFRSIDSDSTNDNPYTISLSGVDTGSFDHFLMDYAPGTTGSDVTDVDLGSIEDDIGKWGWIIVRLKCHATDGILEVWRTTGPDLGGGKRAMIKQFTRTGLGVGFVPSGTFEHTFRQYKFGWHHSSATINSIVFWVGMDEGYYGGVNEGTTFEDVHPFGESPP